MVKITCEICLSSSFFFDQLGWAACLQIISENLTFRVWCNQDIKVVERVL